MKKGRVLLIMKQSKFGDFQHFVRVCLVWKKIFFEKYFLIFSYLIELKGLENVGRGSSPVLISPISPSVPYMVDMCPFNLLMGLINLFNRIPLIMVINNSLSSLLSPLFLSHFFDQIYESRLLVILSPFFHFSMNKEPLLSLSKLSEK